MLTTFRHVTLAVSFTLAAFSTAAAQIGADECAAADSITGTGSFPFDTNNPSDTGTPASSGIEQQCADITNDIWIDWTAPAGLDGHIVQLDTCGSTFDSEIDLWRGTCGDKTPLGCAEFSAQCSGGGGTGLGGALEITVEGGEHYLVQIGFYSFSGFEWGSGDLTITDLGPDPCLSTPPDALEPNDDCASAAPVGAGTFPGLFVARDNADFLRTTVPPGHRYTAVGSVSGLTYQTDFRMFLTDADCQTQLSTSSISSPEKTVVATNRTGAPFDVVLETRLSSSIAFPLCAEYTLDISVEPETCLEALDDGFEGNDTCGSAVPLADGFYAGLHVADSDVDTYRFQLPGQQALRLDAFFQEELGDIDMTLTEWFWCGSGNSVASSSSYSDDEHINYFNQQDETREFILVVHMKPFSGNDFGCYDLMVEGALEPPALNYCNATVNSSGESARIELLGSPTAADQDVFVRSYGLPQGVPGLFFLGPNQIQATFGDGFRCVGGMTQRILPATFAMGPAPSIAQRELNFAAPYASTIQAGAALNFQLWFRDPMAGMSGFNLSDGTGLTFQ